MQKGLESADLIADRFAATGRVECTARIAAHERKTLFRKMLLAPHGISWHRTASLGFAWGLSFLTERAQVVVSRTTNYTGGNNMIICSQEQGAGNYHDKHIDIHNKGTRIKIDTRDAWE